MQKSMEKAHFLGPIKQNRYPEQTVTIVAKKGTQLIVLLKFRFKLQENLSSSFPVAIT